MRLDEEVLMDFFREYISVSVSPTTFLLSSYYLLPEIYFKFWGILKLMHILHLIRWWVWQIGMHLSKCVHFLVLILSHLLLHFQIWISIAFLSLESLPNPFCEFHVLVYEFNVFKLQKSHKLLYPSLFYHYFGLI